MRGSFSPVSTPILRVNSNYSLGSSWRDLHDLHISVAPLRPQTSTKIPQQFGVDSIHYSIRLLIHSSSTTRLPSGWCESVIAFLTCQRFWNVHSVLNMRFCEGARRPVFKSFVIRFDSRKEASASLLGAWTWNATHLRRSGVTFSRRPSKRLAYLIVFETALESPISPATGISPAVSSKFHAAGIFHTRYRKITWRGSRSRAGCAVA